MAARIKAGVGWLRYAAAMTRLACATSSATSTETRFIGTGTAGADPSDCRWLTRCRWVDLDEAKLRSRARPGAAVGVNDWEGMVSLTAIEG